MKIRKFLFLACSGATVLLSSIASSGSATAEMRLAQQPNCSNPQYQAEMNACAALDYKQADKKLNQVYPQVRNKLSGSRREQLTSAQLAWIEFRDANCEFESSLFEGGSMAPMILSGCLARVTKQRTADLESYAIARQRQPNSRNYQASDRLLNQVYQRLLPEVSSPARQRQLKDAELAWIAFRDANCQFEATIASGGNNLCLTRMTEERTRELQEALEQESL